MVTNAVQETLASTRMTIRVNAWMQFGNPSKCLDSVIHAHVRCEQCACVTLIVFIQGTVIYQPQENIARVRGQVKDATFH